MANPRPSNPIKPGETRNPNGRPKKGHSITDMMKDMLGSDIKLKYAIGDAIAEKARQGDVTAIKMLWQYMDGMPVQKQEVEADVKHDFNNLPDDKLEQIITEEVKKLVS